MTMGAVVSLDAVLRDPRIWRRGRPTAPAEGEPSGLAALDAVLPWGGFPRGALTELLLAHDGLGELGLLLPMLARLDASLPIVFVAPPYLPYAPALAAAGLAPERVMEVRTPPERALWAAEQCLRAGCCGAVLAWHDGGDDRALRVARDGWVRRAGEVPARRRGAGTARSRGGWSRGGGRRAAG